MFRKMLKQLKIALILLILFTIFTGLIYPLCITGLAQLLFPWQANGSLIKKENQLMGSVLIGQAFDSPQYFWSRPSATSPYPYNAASSSGSNMGPLNPVFLQTVQDRVNDFKKDATHHDLIPVDLVTASGSGLDPEISPLAAFYQAPRIAKEIHLPQQLIEDLIKKSIKNRQFGLLGEPRINVLQLNLALDQLRSAHGRASSKPR